MRTHPREAATVHGIDIGKTVFHVVAVDGHGRLPLMDSPRILAQVGALSSLHFQLEHDKTRDSTARFSACKGASFFTARACPAPGRDRGARKARDRLTAAPPEC
jgi:hypothetical protein